MLKCLKPISERKTRRLLVVAHCMRQRLPNLARLIGVILTDSMDEDAMRPMMVMQVAILGGSEEGKMAMR